MFKKLCLICTCVLLLCVACAGCHKTAQEEKDAVIRKVYIEEAYLNSGYTVTEIVKDSPIPKLIAVRDSDGYKFSPVYFGEIKVGDKVKILSVTNYIDETGIVHFFIVAIKK